MRTFASTIVICVLTGCSGESVKTKRYGDPEFILQAHKAGWNLGFTQGVIAGRHPIVPGQSPDLVTLRSNAWKLVEAELGLTHSNTTNQKDQ